MRGLSVMGWLMLCVLILIAAFVAGDIGLTRVEQAQALQCARTSDGADSSIVDCFTERGLPVPEDMQ